MLGSLAKFNLEIAGDCGLARLVVVVALLIVVLVGWELLCSGDGMCNCASNKLGFVNTLR